MNETPRLSGLTGLPDSKSLSAIERFLKSQDMVTEVETRGNNYQPRFIRAVLDTDCDSEDGDPSELVVFWYTSGDFSIRYRAAATGDAENYLWLRDADFDEIRCQHQESGEMNTDTLLLESYNPIEVILVVLATIKNADQN